MIMGGTLWTLGMSLDITYSNLIANWLAFGFLGIGMVCSSIYPRWLGWFGIVLGIVGLPIGAAMSFVGREAVWNFFMVLAFLTILWFFALGIWMALKGVRS
jgi:hypothetical protein